MSGNERGNVTVLDSLLRHNLILASSRRNFDQNSTDDCYQSCLVGITAGATAVGLFIMAIVFRFCLVSCPRNTLRNISQRVESPYEFDLHSGSMLRCEKADHVLPADVAFSDSHSCQLTHANSDTLDDSVPHESNPASLHIEFFSNHSDPPIGLPFPMHSQDTGQRMFTLTPLGSKLNAELALVPNAHLLMPTSSAGFIFRAVNLSNDDVIASDVIPTKSGWC